MKGYNHSVSVVYIALPIALLLALAALAAFIWSVRTGQMDDLETPRHRMLFDDEQRSVSGDAGRSSEDDARP